MIISYDTFNRVQFHLPAIAHTAQLKPLCLAAACISVPSFQSGDNDSECLASSFSVMCLLYKLFYARDLFLVMAMQSFWSIMS